MRAPLLAVLVLVASGCAGLSDVTGMGGGDAGACTTTLAFFPEPAYASPLSPVRATASVVGAPGVLDYSWTVTYMATPVTTTRASTDGSQIEFLAVTPGPYTVTVQLAGASASGCSETTGVLNVMDPNAISNAYRLRVVAPSTVAPPQEQLVVISGGADFVRAIALDPGVFVSGAVRSGSTAGALVAAYLRFMPIATPGAFTEIYSTASAGFATRLLGQNHDVLVVPESSALAPRLVSWSPGMTSLVVRPGTLVTGVVRDPAGAGLGGAKVQLASGGVPSTLATTASDGSFSLRADYPAGATVTVDVTPPATSGLPRLAASAAFDLGQAVQVAYASSLATCDLQGAQVVRATAPLAAARVTVVGALMDAAGTITAGTAASAQGAVRAAALTDGAGALLSLRVPRAPLAAVVEPSASDASVVALDTTSCPAGLVLEAPPPVADAGAVRGPDGAPLAGVRIEATPVGPLSLASPQLLSTTSDASGAFSLELASGGRYDVRLVDPQARGALRTLPDVLAGTIPATSTLPAALRLTGKVSVAGSTQPVLRTSVQLLCATCTGVDGARPIAQSATSAQSEYLLAVPDPGTR